MAGAVNAGRARHGAEREGGMHVGTRERIAGIPVDRLAREEVVGRVASAVGGGAPLRILVANANKAWLAARDPRLQRVLDQAELVVGEWAMAWASRRLRRPPVPFVGGLLLMVRLLEEAERRGWSVYLLGGRPRVVAALVERLRRERPSLRVAGAHHGYLDDEALRAVRRELGASRPDLLFVAMGSPLQELWIADEFDGAGAHAVLGVGGSFDVLAGVKRDAPAWARGRGLEWVWRLAQDPGQLARRYAVVNTWFLWQVLKERAWSVRPDGRK